MRILCSGIVLRNYVFYRATHEVLFFTISMGVRQGRIVSPKLFSVYMDDPSKLLINLGIGCFIDNVCCIHVFYSDDLCLQELLHFCYSYSFSLHVNFNTLKSFCVGMHQHF